MFAQSAFQCCANLMLSTMLSWYCPILDVFLMLFWCCLVNVLMLSTSCTTLILPLMLFWGQFQLCPTMACSPARHILSWIILEEGLKSKVNTNFSSLRAKHIGVGGEYFGLRKTFECWLRVLKWRWFGAYLCREATFCIWENDKYLAGCFCDASKLFVVALILFFVPFVRWLVDTGSCMMWHFCSRIIYLRIYPPARILHRKQHSFYCRYYSVLCYNKNDYFHSQWYMNTIQNNWFCCE